ncbi:AP-3 complex subunit beta-2 [Golovinomyces cichoracearum]|uniref:AP complex subunit beta n=1 Tax=Golovinomyces cichoracearum TaxID=62708 RepID=A0A420IZD7_9PEZI|nr:AP-3 complex subunit beta-2 [Golovinomyces cichoracearum]
MESISRMSNLLESARELTLDAAQSTRSSRSSSKFLPDSHIKKLLDSRNDRDVLDGLRRIISMMYCSRPCLTFFSSVVKNVASPNIEIKKLVYVFLLSHAEQEQSLALLSINTIQKSLSDGNQQVRALALKTMSGIRVSVISKIVSLAIKKGLGDMSPLVRKTTALAIVKCYRLDPSTLPEMRDYLSLLLGDKQPYVAGAAVKAFMEVCPEEIDLIHKHYRGLLRAIVDMDEWSQLATLKLMTVYSRKCFPKNTRQENKIIHKSKDFYCNEGQNASASSQEEQPLDPDLELLLTSIKPLLLSRNSAVVIAVTRCYVSLGVQSYIDLSIGPLIALLRGSRDIKHIALHNIVSVCMIKPEAFVKYLSHFLIHVTDQPQIWELKLELLTLVYPHCDSYLKNLILNELEHFTQGSSDDEIVGKAVRAIGRCAQSDSGTSSRCMRILLKHSTSMNQNLVQESMIVIRHLIQKDPDSHIKTVIWLAKNLDSTSNPTARASIVWLVGEFSGINHGNNVAADVLRILTKDFANETEEVKLQIVLLAAKVYLHYLNRVETGDSHSRLDFESQAYSLQKENKQLDNEYSKSVLNPKHPIAAIWNHVLLLARYDTSYDLRDRARMYKALLADPSSTQLASLMLLAPKPVPFIPSPSERSSKFMLGSASLVVSVDDGFYGIRGYEALPDFVLPGNEPSPSLRKTEISKPYYEANKIVSAGEIIHG